MFERTWRFRDIPGSMLVRVSVETLSSHPLAGWPMEEAAVHSPRGVIGESPRFKEAPSPTFSDGRGSGSSMPHWRRAKHLPGRNELENDGAFAPPEEEKRVRVCGAVKCC